MPAEYIQIPKHVTVCIVTVKWTGDCGFELKIFFSPPSESTQCVLFVCILPSRKILLSVVVGQMEIAVYDLAAFAIDCFISRTMIQLFSLWFSDFLN